MKKIVLFGAGGLGRETAELISDINKKEKLYILVGYVVDDVYYQDNQIINDIPIIGNTHWLVDHKNDVYCVLAIGDAKKRLRVFTSLRQAGVKFESIIGTNTKISSYCKIGNGVIIRDGCSISPNAVIEDGVLLNGDLAIGHDCIIHECAVIYPNSNIGGYAEVGVGAQIGTMSFLNPHSIVGDGAVVAPLSAVYGKVKKNICVMGNPAKKMVF